MPSRRLKTSTDVRRYLANLILRVERDELEPAKAGRLGYLVNILLAAVRADDLERRLAALEKRIEEGVGNVN